MDTSLKRNLKQTTSEWWYIVFLAAGAFSFAVFAVGRVPSGATHEGILTSLRAIDINHASLQRDVLQARAGLLKNDDPLVGSVVNLHSAVSKLRTLFHESSVQPRSQLDTELSKLAVSIDRDEGLVESFKTENALLQNSLSTATQMLTELHSRSDTAVVRGLAMSGDLGNLMMRFAAQPDDRLGRDIQLQLNQMLKFEAPGAPEVRSYVAHAQMILNTLPSVDNTIASIQASRTSFEAQTLQKQYLDAYAMISVRSAWSRIFIGGISVLLCVYIAFLIYRLRTQTYRLTQQLAFESIVSEIRKRFNEEFDSVSAAVSDCLLLLAVFFNASRCAFATISSNTGHVEQIFGDADGLVFEALAGRFSEDIWGTETDPAFHWERPYHNLHQGEFQALHEDASSAGSLATASIDESLVGLLFLEHREIGKAPGSDHIRFLENAVTVLAQCLKASSEREQKQALESRLEHAQRLEALGTLAGGIAHEFNNTLGAMLGYGEMALQVGRSSARIRQYVQEIVASGQRAKHIIDQILTFSRKRERISKPFDMKETVIDIFPLAKISIPETMTISLQVPDILPAVIGNPIEIQQVIMNLCMNAAQASADGGHIEVTVEQVKNQVKLSLSHGELPAGEYVLLTVADRGSGIPQSVLPHIFEPFFTTRAKSGGTGLGLTAVHGHVIGMSGKIDVESRPNEGTRFRLFFPSANRPPVPLVQFFNERTIPLGNGQVVLIAQSDTALRLMYEEKVAALGYEPFGFPSLSALKSWLTSNDRRPDLVLLDLDLWPRLPNLSDVVKEFSPIATLFLAERERDDIDHRALAEISILRKPVRSISLATTLFNMINRQATATT